MENGPPTWEHTWKSVCSDAIVSGDDAAIAALKAAAGSADSEHKKHKRCTEQWYKSACMAFAVTSRCEEKD